MNCRRVKPRLSLHHEGELPAREAAAVTAHLADCPACRRLRDRLLAMSAALRDLPAPLPSPGLHQRAVRQWLSERDARPRWLPALAAGLAAALLAAILGQSGIFDAKARNERKGNEFLAAKTRRPEGTRRKRERDGKPNSMRKPGNQEDPIPDFLASSSNLAPAHGGGTHSSIHPDVALSPFSRFRGKNAGVAPVPDDMAIVNRSPAIALQRFAALPASEWERLEARVRRDVAVKDDFITIPFPRLASTSDRQIVAAIDHYKHEAAIVDPRLAREVTAAYKGMALSDLCDQLRAQTGVQLAAGPSVADEKVTVFCEKVPLREVMRQLSRPFGYTWIRSRKEGGDYQYELLQDLKSQLLEEELRNRDRNAALIALDRDMQRYRPYLNLSPDEALARAKSAGEGDKKLFETLGGAGWGPIQLYFRLSPQDQAALLAGQELRFSQEPKTGERPLPPDIARGVLQARREVRIGRDTSGQGGAGKDPGEDQFHFVPADAPDGLPPSAVSRARAAVTLKLEQTELGRFGFSGASDVLLGGNDTGEDNGPYAIGQAPSAHPQAGTRPENAALNAQFARDPALRGKVTVAAGAGGQGSGVSPASSPQAKTQNPNVKITTADALEALHRASHMPIVADFYTRLYAPETVSVQDRPLFDALNQLSDAMRLRWNEEDGWLQFRSASFYNDRLKEVPNRLLARWAAARQAHGALRLDDLIEIAGLSDAQLDARDMAEGAKELWGLAEWGLACNRALRPHLRWMASLSPAEREKLQRAPGLRFTDLPLAQQQRFIALALGDSSDAISSLDELSTAAVQIDEELPGAFEWKAPERPEWKAPEKEHSGPPEPLSPVRGATRAAALAAARQLDPQADLTQIQPTEAAITLLYYWGTARDNGRLQIHTTGPGDTSINRSRNTDKP